MRPWGHSPFSSSYVGLEQATRPDSWASLIEYVLQYRHASGSCLLGTWMGEPLLALADVADLPDLLDSPIQVPAHVAGEVVGYSVREADDEIERVNRVLTAAAALFRQAPAAWYLRVSAHSRVPTWIVMSAGPAPPPSRTPSRSLSRPEPSEADRPVARCCAAGLSSCPGVRHGCAQRPSRRCPPRSLWRAPRSGQKRFSRSARC